MTDSTSKGFRADEAHGANGHAPTHLAEARFQALLLDSVQEAVVATDLEGIVTYWGRGAEELYGYRADEAIGHPLQDLLDNGDDCGVQQRMQEVLQTGSWKGEHRQRRKDRSYFWASSALSPVLDEQGNVTGFIGIDIDITARKQAGEEIDQLELAIENAMQGISRLDCEGRFIMVKPLYSRMLGYEGDELIGQSWAVTVPEEDHPAAVRGCETMLREGRATLECRARRKDGTVFHKQLLLVKTFDDQGNHDGHYCFMSDVTLRRQAEDELRSRESELAHVSRLSTMGEMVAGIAHEINQPLYAIANLAEAAGRESGRVVGTEAAELHELNQMIAEQAVRAGDIIRRLQAFVRKSDGFSSEVDFHALIDDAIAMLSPLTRNHHASIQFVPDQSVVLVKADAVQLQQVLVNLIRNAIEAVAGRDQREVVVRTRLNEREVQASVEDTGSGTEDAAKLFDAFYTTKSSGLGMGLAISRTIVEAHGGKIWAEASPGGGLVLHFTLPVLENQG